MASCGRATHLLRVAALLWAVSAGDAGAGAAGKEILACKHKQTIDFLLREKARKGESHYKGLLYMASSDKNCITFSSDEKYTIIKKDDGDGFVLIRDCCTGQNRWTRTDFIK